MESYATVAFKQLDEKQLAHAVITAVSPLPPSPHLAAAKAGSITPLPNWDRLAI